MTMLIIICINSDLDGIIFWPNNVGKSHRIMYDGYMSGWNSK